VGGDFPKNNMKNLQFRDGTRRPRRRGPHQARFWLDGVEMPSSGRPGANPAAACGRRTGVFRANFASVPISDSQPSNPVVLSGHAIAHAPSRRTDPSHSLPRVPVPQILFPASCSLLPELQPQTGPAGRPACPSWPSVVLPKSAVPGIPRFVSTPSTGRTVVPQALSGPLP
jgi:hypothetical protein